MTNQQQFQHLVHMFRASTKAYSPAVAYRDKVDGVWITYTYAQVGEMVDTVARGLLSLGLQVGESVGILSHNCAPFAFVDYAAMALRGMSVPMHAAYSAKNIAHIINDAKLKVLFVGNMQQYEKLVSILPQLVHRPRLVSLDADVKKLNESVITWDELMQMGAQSEYSAELAEREATIDPSDTAAVLYTSGTSGEPKGVCLTHLNFIHQVEAFYSELSLEPSDRSISFLPLSHAYEKGWCYCLFSRGARTSFVADPKKIVAFLPEVEPNVFVAVPRLYEQVYATVMEKVRQGSVIKKKIFNWAVATGKEFNTRLYASKGTGLTLGTVERAKYALAHKLVLGKICQAIGGPKKFLSVGGAPLKKEIEEFFLSFGVLVCQGYGLTETSPVLTCNTPKHFKFGTVGLPLPGVEIKIAESGEILARGPNVMKGYLNLPEATKEVLVDGWFHTGDVGEFDADGYLRITDRLKDLCVTAGGKKVAPQAIEAVLAGSSLIDQIMVVAEGRSYVTALVVPAFPGLEAYAHRHGINYSSPADLVEKTEIYALYEKHINKMQKDLNHYSQIKKFRLLPTAFSIQDGEMTPTLKVRRAAVMSKYANVIETMYDGTRTQR